MITYLFALYPAAGGEETVKMRMLAYHAELSDIHTDVLGPALRRLVRGKGEFLPTVYQIRRSAAYVIRAARVGRDPLAPGPEPAEIDEARYLKIGPKPGEACPYPSLARGSQKQLTGGA